jgi:hypothetical protein
LVKRAQCSAPGTHPPEQPPHSGRRVARGHERPAERAGGRSHRAPPLLQGFRCQLGHMLANRPHLRSIGLVSCQQRYLRRDRRASAAPRGSLAQSGANRLRIAQPLVTDHVERSRRAVIQAHMQRATHKVSVAQNMLRSQSEIARTARRCRRCPRGGGAPRRQDSQRLDHRRRKGRRRGLTTPQISSQLSQLSQLTDVSVETRMPPPIR